MKPAGWWRLACAALVLPSSVCAQPAPLGLNQSVWLQLHGVRATIGSTLRLDNGDNASLGTSLGLEDDLGLKSHQWLPSVLAGARLGSDWRTELEAYALRRSGTRQLDRNITVGGTVFEAAATVDTDFDTTVYRASIGYSFVRTPTAEFGASLGLHVTRVRAAVAATAVIDETEIAVDRSVVNQVHTVPLPTLGLYGTFALSDAWVLSARADLLRLKVGGSRGNLVNLAANVIYRITPHTGVGFGYRSVDYDLRQLAGSIQGRFDYRYNGPQVMVDIGF